MANMIGAGALGGLALGAANIANAQNSSSNGFSDSWGSSWGASASNAYANSDAWSLSKAIENSESQSASFNESSSRTYGREASAADIERAAEANQVQRDLWQEQADYNAKQAEIDREFQKEMSNTAYQRAVVDLLKAGLNPILAVGNMGASTPVGAMASSGLATAHKAQTFPESESYSYGQSASSSWSHGESGSASKSKSQSETNSWSKNGSSEGSHAENTSKSTTQLYDLIGNMGETMVGVANTAKEWADKTVKDAKSGTNRNGVAGWQSYKNR